MPAFDLNNEIPDPEIEGQTYVCISYAPHPTLNTIFFKIRGCFPTLEEAQKHAMELSQSDPIFPIYVGEMGKFLPAQSNMINLNSPPWISSEDTESQGGVSIPINIIAEVSNGDVNGNGEGEGKGEGNVEGDGNVNENVNENVNVYGDVNAHGSQNDVNETGETSNDKIEVRELAEEKNPVCLACHDARRNALFLPCRHISFCLECSNMHIKKSNKCPICRTQIKELINVFIN